MIDTKAIKDFSIDKSDWDKIKFGDVVFEPKESVKDAVAAGIEHVVGLEHIDSEDIHLRRSEGIEESTTFTKKFSVDDVLFGRRRAYLKKAAQAKFEGICSGDIIVMRAGERLVPDLLPFIVNNENFFDFAITHSAGGLSPRVKFKDLANYEFLLPPKDQQLNLAALLHSADSVMEYEKSCLNKLFIAKKSINHELFNGKYFGVESEKHALLGEIPRSWRMVPLGDLVDAPICYGLVQPGKSVAGGIPIVQIKNIIGFNSDKMHYSSPDIEKSFKRSRISEGDILLSIKGTLGVCGIVPDGFEGNIGRDSAKIRIRDKTLSLYISLLLKSQKYQDYFWRIKVGSTRHEVSIDSLKKMPILVPEDENVMLEIIKVLGNIESSIIASEEKIIRSKVLLKTLVGGIR